MVTSAFDSPWAILQLTWSGITNNFNFLRRTGRLLSQRHSF
ncbi:hypothetical protein J2S70_000468 [Trueperella bonasi]|uniref:Uncharacterized protein n=1 Tax=Trueperella bonasi TaxID=312286 RepID=A0ABT9NER2_9ACTO|nr:hypothetical protein [Trueperella bonasi]